MYKTDLIMETCEILKESNVDISQFSGVKSQEYLDNTCKVTKVSIINAEGSLKIGKPIGEYFTVEIEDKTTKNAIFCLSNVIRELVGNEKKVLIAGIGNKNITSDALGPLVCDNTVVTRHLLGNKYFKHLNETSAISTNVLGKTGVETSDIIKSLLENVKPECIIAVDALASRKTHRLGNVIQVSNTGITPGAGVSNERKAINFENLGVKVIAIGVPTVITGGTLAYEIDKKADLSLYEDIVVTPKEIDTIIKKTSTIIAQGINYAINPVLDEEDIEMFLE